MVRLAAQGRLDEPQRMLKVGNHGVDLGKDKNVCGEGRSKGVTRQRRESVADHGLSHLVDLGDGSDFEEAASLNFVGVIACRLVVSEVEEWITQRVIHADQP